MGEVESPSIQDHKRIYNRHTDNHNLYRSNQLSYIASFIFNHAGFDIHRWHPKQ